MLFSRPSGSIKEHILDNVKLKKTEHSICSNQSSNCIKPNFPEDVEFLQKSSTFLSQNCVSLSANKRSSAKNLKIASRKTYEKIKACNLSQPINKSELCAITSQNNFHSQSEKIAYKNIKIKTPKLSRPKKKNYWENTSFNRLNLHTSCGFHENKSRPCFLSTTLKSFKPSNEFTESQLRNRSLPVPTAHNFFVCLPKPKKVSLPPSLIGNFKTKSKTAFFPSASSSNSFQRDPTITSKCKSKLLNNSIAMTGNQLRHRLTLIHCYGNDYEKIALQHKNQLEREKTAARLELKKATKIKDELIKEEQRKKIYALNRFMTKLEKKRFEEFMKNVSN